eukprot:6172194-Pleurochrysis_carterae.AAC.1
MEIALAEKQQRLDPLTRMDSLAKGTTFNNFQAWCSRLSYRPSRGYSGCTEHNLAFEDDDV